MYNDCQIRLHSSCSVRIVSIENKIFQYGIDLHALMEGHKNSCVYIQGVTVYLDPYHFFVPDFQQKALLIYTSNINILSHHLGFFQNATSICLVKECYLSTI